MGEDLHFSENEDLHFSVGEDLLFSAGEDLHFSAGEDLHFSAGHRMVKSLLLCPAESNCAVNITSQWVQIDICQKLYPFCHNIVGQGTPIQEVSCPAINL